MSRDDLTEQDHDRASPLDFDGDSRAFLIALTREGVLSAEVPESGEAVIGRGDGATLLLPDSRVSRKHARVFWEGGELFLEDLGGRNPTVINGAELRANRVPVRAGDAIRIAGLDVRVALASRGAKSDIEEASREFEAEDGIVVADENMAKVFGFARRVARATTTVLVVGETGVGKEVVAGRIHAWSSRSAKRLVRVNCAALQENLVESELFGHERGAFTGAEKRKVGFIEAASESSLFLDEVGELSLPVQAKLLSTLENRAIIRVGSTEEVKVDVRIIAATHRDLPEQVSLGRFREDLYYRIGVVILRVPPLRERPSEVALLARLFARRFGENLGFERASVSKEANDVLLRHAFPGNVRELRNAIEHAVLLSEDGLIRPEHLPETFFKPASRSVPPPSAPSNGRPTPGAQGVKAALSELEKASIVEALALTGGNRTHAAKNLGISLRSLLYKIQKYGID